MLISDVYLQTWSQLLAVLLCCCHPVAVYSTPSPPKCIPTQYRIPPSRREIEMSHHCQQNGCRDLHGCECDRHNAHVPPKGIETCVNHRANTQSGICEVGQLYAGVPLKMLLLQGSQSGLCKSHESVPRSALPGVICQTCACASAQQWECEIVEAYLGHMSCSFREQLTIYWINIVNTLTWVWVVDIVRRPIFQATFPLSRNEDGRATSG